MSYDANAPPGTFEHTAMLDCPAHGESSVHFRIKGSNAPWQCVACALDMLAKIIFEEVYLVEEAVPSYDAEFSLGKIGTSPDEGRRGWTVILDCTLEGIADSEPQARLDAAKAIHNQLTASLGELSELIHRLEIQK
jgi:hypothetical protein